MAVEDAFYCMWLCNKKRNIKETKGKRKGKEGDKRGKGKKRMKYPFFIQVPLYPSTTFSTKMVVSLPERVYHLQLERKNGWKPHQQFRR